MAEKQIKARYARYCDSIGNTSMGVYGHNLPSGYELITSIKKITGVAADKEHTDEWFR